MANTLWKTKEWKEKRDIKIQEAGSKCQWPHCEERSILAPHHSIPLRTRGLYNAIAYGSFLVSEDYRKLPFEEIDVCPSCGKQTYYKRKTKTPKYRCNICHTNFEKPNRINSVRKKGFQEAFNNFKKKRERVLAEAYNKEKEKRLERYISLKDTVVLCKKHHFLAQRGYVPCAECAKPTKPTSEGLCFDCLIKKGIIEKCPKCGKKYYRPDKRKMCRDCELSEGFDYEDD